MFTVVRKNRPRRIAAFVQLMLFVFSASTSLLPCGDMDAGNSSSHHGMATAVAAVSDSDVHHHHDVAPRAESASVTPSTPDTPASSSAPSTETTCPWVVGCVGMVQYTIDASWRAIEHGVPFAVPNGDVLRRVITHREIDSPPPRI